MKIQEYCDPIKILGIQNNFSPTFVEIHPTNHCNMNCSYCSYKERKKDKVSLSTTNLMNLCTDLLNLQTKAVCFSGGGEPTLHNSLKQAITYLYEGGIKVSVLTNGLNANLIEEVSPMCTYILIHVSCYDLLRGHSKVPLGYISKLKQSTLGVVGGRIVLDNKNKKDYRKLIEVSLKLGFDYIQCCPAISYEDNCGYLTTQECNDILKDDIFKDKRVMWIEKKQYEKRENFCACLNKKVHATVKANGDICLCPSHLFESDKSVIGNVNSKRFWDLWHSDLHNETINEIQRDPNYICDQCRFRKYNFLLERYQNMLQNTHRYFL